MSTQHFFNPNNIDIKSRDELRGFWLNIPDNSSREIIVVEHQYLIFQMGLLDKLNYNVSGQSYPS
jgi:hypothetical protein